MESSNFTHFAFANHFNQPAIFPFIFLLSHQLFKGHTCIDLKQLDQYKEILDENNINTILDIEALYNNDLVGSDKFTFKPFIIYNNKLYIQKYFKYEQNIVQKISDIISTEDISLRIESFHQIQNKLPQNLFSAINDEHINWQDVACKLAYLHHFFILTGGPGTGKTTTISKLLITLLTENVDLNIIIAAPTGKASARIKESFANIPLQLLRNNIIVDETILDAIQEIEATTIHRLLGYIHNNIHFKYNQDNPLPYDLIIIDESSMIDIVLFERLLKAIDPNRTKLILLGDKFQLASVEAGSVFGDLCNAIQVTNVFNQEMNEYLHFKNRDNIEDNIFQNRIVTLQKSYRFDDEKGIGQLSKAILDGNHNILDLLYTQPNNEVVLQSNEQDYIQDYINIILDKNNGYFYESDIMQALKKINNAKILCANNNGANGVHEINSQIEHHLLPYIKKVKNEKNYHNELIMVMKNQPELEIYNGDIGLIRRNNLSTNKELVAYFWKNDSECIEIFPNNIEQYQSAHALTIHKSQGSEYNQVFINLLNEHFEELITKELLYTGITRAKEKVIVMANSKILHAAIDNKTRRNSGITRNSFKI